MKPKLVRIARTITVIRLESVILVDYLPTENLLIPGRMPSVLPYASCWKRYTENILVP